MSGDDAPGPAEVHLELDFMVSVPLVSIVRRFVGEFCEEVLRDSDATERVAMATHELLENAERYSRDGAAHLCVDVSPGAIRIRISSDAQDVHVARLDAAMRAMGGEPGAHYQRLMRQTVGHRNGSGLGLARVRAEGEMQLSHEVEGSRVSIVAQTRFGAERSGSNP